MNYNTILVTDRGSIRTIALNRPERRNALTAEMQLELIRAMENSLTDGCRVLVLTGTGTAFCSGLDLLALQTMGEKTAAEHRTDAANIARLFRTLYGLPVPTIAAVNGPAVAGGAGLATICDFTLATPAARFGFTEARIGFVPALVSVFLMMQLGEKRARDLLLTARIVEAEEALRLGLVNEIAAPEDLPARVDSLADVLIANSPQSIAATKKLLAAQNKTRLDAAIEAALDANAQARETEDFTEGVAAFLERRKPGWSP